ncbi:MAG: hypothetical protein R3A52_02720 [Polyangiales bacterium]
MLERLADALDRAGVPRPAGFTHAVEFRRCERCGARNVVKDGVLVCAECDADLPRAVELRPHSTVSAPPAPTCACVSRGRASAAPFHWSRGFATPVPALGDTTRSVAPPASGSLPRSPTAPRAATIESPRWGTPRAPRSVYQALIVPASSLPGMPSGPSP